MIDSKQIVLSSMGIATTEEKKVGFFGKTKKLTGAVVNALSNSGKKKGLMTALISAPFLYLGYTAYSVGVFGSVADSVGVLPSLSLWSLLSGMVVWLMTEDSMDGESILFKGISIAGITMSLSALLVAMTGDGSMGGSLGEMMTLPLSEAFGNTYIVGSIFALILSFMAYLFSPVIKSLMNTFGKKKVEKEIIPLLTYQEDEGEVFVAEKNQSSDGDYLVELLEDFGVKGVEAVNVERGHVLTDYTLKLPRGMKPAKVVENRGSLSNSLGVHGIVIDPVVAGQPQCISVKIPLQSEERKTVKYVECADSEEYNNTDAVIPMILGADIRGNTVTIDLTEMKHITVAGETGAGKSKLVEVMLLSMLQKVSPDDLELIIVDPKQLEMTTFENVPHLRGDIITDPAEAQTVLLELCDEMDARYGTIADYARKTGKSVKNIATYNKEMKEEGSNHKMKYLVIEVDEFADLMMSPTADKKVIEEAVVRLTQKGRAAGIHLILATQRPTVDVVTGLIKANMPCKIGLTVSSAIDSRVILDSSGCERLLGRGDMLISNSKFGMKPMRVHGAFIEDNESVSSLNALNDFWGENKEEEMV